MAGRDLAGLVWVTMLLSATWRRIDRGTAHVQGGTSRTAERKPNIGRVWDGPKRPALMAQKPLANQEQLCHASGVGFKFLLCEMDGHLLNTCWNHKSAASPSLRVISSTVRM